MLFINEKIYEIIDYNNNEMNYMLKYQSWYILSSYLKQYVFNIPFGIQQIIVKYI